MTNKPDGWTSVVTGMGPFPKYDYFAEYKATKPFFGSPGRMKEPEPASFIQMVGRQKRLPDEMIMVDGLSKKEIFECYTMNMQDRGRGHVLTPLQKECAQMMWA